MKSFVLLLATLLVPRPGLVRADDLDFTPKIYATRADGSPPWELATLKEYSCAQFPELSPDGTHVALGGWKAGECDFDSHVLLVNLNDGTVEDLGMGGMPSWSPDGTLLAYSTYGPDYGVHVRPVQGGFEERIETGAWGIQWSPDGRWLAYVRGGNLIIFDPVTKKRRGVFREDQLLPYQEINWNFAWSPDSRRICFNGRRQPPAPGARSPDEIAIISVDGDPQLIVCCAAASVSEEVAWHPDGSRIVMTKAGQLYEFNSGAHDPPRRVASLAAGRTNRSICWSRDGEILLFMSCPARPAAKAGIQLIEVNPSF